MTDYSTLDNNTLRRRIAERLGYKVQSHTYDDGTWYWLVDARGIKQTFLYPTEDDLWTAAFHGDIPDWTEDANAALVISFEDGICVRPSITRVNWVAQKLIDIPFSTDKWEVSTATYAEADMPARAICLAWLAWKDTNDGG